MKKQRLLIATSNQNKVKEIKESLATDSYEVVSLLDFPEREEVDEPYFTFEENALHMFIPRDNNPEKETYSEMTPTEREVQSHRLQAFTQVLTYLNDPIQYHI